MKISASIYSNPAKSIEDIVVELNYYHVDFLHVDCNDDLTVFDDIKLARSHTRTPIDLHIITEDPQKFFKEIVNNKIEYVCFQHEPLKEPLILPKELKSKSGIAIMNDTPVEVFEEYFKAGFSFGLLMTTTPGQSGGLFNPITFERVKKFKTLFPSKPLHVDGGVNDQIAAELRALGVDCSISGSYLVKSEEIGTAMSKLKSDINNLNFEVSDFMIRINQLPIVFEENLNLTNVVKTITEYKMGFCLITDENHKLMGIITDGDLRNELLKNIADLNKIQVLNMVNKTPLSIKSDAFVSDALQLIANFKKQITFLPIVDDFKTIVGVVSINQLIKGTL